MPESKHQGHIMPCYVLIISHFCSAYKSSGPCCAANGLWQIHRLTKRFMAQVAKKGARSLKINSSYVLPQSAGPKLGLLFDEC